MVVIAYLSGLLILLIGGGASPWWALACAINPGLIIGVQNDLTEPLMIALSLAGLLLYLRGRILWAAIALALALLAREVAILFLVPLLVGEMLARRVGRTLVLLGGLIPYLTWQVVLLGAFGTTGATGSQGNVGLPLAGIWAIVREVRHASPRSALVHQSSILAVVAFVVAALLIGLARSVRRYDVVAGSIVTHGVAALFGGPAIWVAYTSAARVFGGLYPLAIFTHVRRPTLATALLVVGSVLLTAFTIIRLVAISPALSYYLTPSHHPSARRI